MTFKGIDIEWVLNIMMANIIDFLNNHTFFTLLLIISLGYILGQISFKGFSLESSGILLVALLAGHLGVNVDPIFKIFGLALFIYAIGLQAGPRFFSFFKKEGMVLNLVAMGIVSIGALVTMGFILILGIDKATAIGIFAGALTSTPGLAAAQESTASSLTSIGYGVAYPIGVLLVIFYIKLLPRLLRSDPHKEAEQEKRALKTAPIMSWVIMIKNPSVFGKKLHEVKLPAATGAIISRLMRDNSIQIPQKNTILKEHDLVKVVGTQKALITAEIMLGQRTKDPIPGGMIEVQRFIITNKKLVGKTVAEINMTAAYNANITRIRRHGIDLPATSNQRLEWGDRVMVVGEKEIMEKLTEKFGNNIKHASAGNIFSIILGISIGMLIGMIPFSIGRVIQFQMGITGGILLSALILSNRPKLGFMIWRAPMSIVNFIREMGLVLFLAAVGTASGRSLFTVIRTQGFTLLLMSIVISLVPLVIITWIAHRRLKIRLLPLSGILTGGMTSTPGLAVASSLADSPSPMIMYASVYPIAMVSMIVWSKILAVL